MLNKNLKILAGFNLYRNLSTLTPTFIFEKRILKKRATDYLKAAVCLPNFKAFYAIKSNHYHGILKTLVKLGFGLDASSGKELMLASKAGAKEVIFTGPGKTTDELTFATTNFKNIIIHLDSWGELERLQKLKLKRKLDVCVRINTNVQASWEKFGIPLQNLRNFYQAVKKTPRLNFLGIHFHNSWNNSSTPYLKTLTLLRSYLAKNFLSAELAKFKVLDIGGGLLCDDLEENLAFKSGKGEILERLNGHNLEQIQNMNSFFQDLSNFYQTKLKSLLPNITIFAEPGRLISSHCFHVLLKVLDIKNKNLVILDGGTDNFGFANCKKFYFPIINLSHPANKEKKLIIAGALCSIYDVWGYYCYASKLEVGDVLLLPFQGAYTYSTAQNFIKKLAPVYDLI